MQKKDHTLVLGEISPEVCLCKVASIIVTFNPLINDLEHIFGCHRESGTDHLIIVDNNSENFKEIKDIASRVLDGFSFNFILNEENIGLGAALNRGINYASILGCSHVALFDQDSTVPARLVNKIAYEYFKLEASGVRVGAVGPAFVDSRSGSEYPQSLLKGFRLKKVWLSEFPASAQKVSFIITSGTFMAISTFREVGQMREDFFIDCIDIEWCFRAQTKGFFIFCTSKAAMQHSIGDHRIRSLGREISIHSPKRRYYMARNSIYLARLSTVPLNYRLREIFLSLFRTPIFLWSVRFSPKYIQNIFIGYFHGVTRRLVK